jgi:hypothetical protein
MVIWAMIVFKVETIAIKLIAVVPILPGGFDIIFDGVGAFASAYKLRITRRGAGGELVWEYVIPYFGGTPINNRVFRAYHYSAEEIARAKETGRS